VALKLFQRGAGGAFYLRGAVASVSVYESTRTTDRRTADAIRIRRESEILNRVALGKKATATLAEALLNYINAGGEKRFLEPILRHFGQGARLRDIDNQAVNQAAAKLYPTAAPSTINRQLITPLRAILTMAAEDGLCDLKRIRSRKATAQKLRWLTPAEFDRLDQELAPHLKGLCAFMIGTGARVREALSLQVSTLHLSSGQALLTDTKNGSARMVQMPARAVDAISKSNPPEAGTVFANNHGRPYPIRPNMGGQIRRGFNNARDRAGLGGDVTPHTLRHTWATWHYAQNRDFGALLDLGGWSKADVANIYRKAAPDDLAGALLDAGWDFRRGARIDARQPISLRAIK
jgi:integrase